MGRSLEEFARNSRHQAADRGGKLTKKVRAGDVEQMMSSAARRSQQPPNQMMTIRKVALVEKQTKKEAREASLVELNKK